MALFRVIDKGTVKKVNTVRGKRVVVLSDDYDGEYVRVYRIKEVKFPIK